MTPLALQMTDSAWAAIGGISAATITPIILFILKDRSDAKARAEARADAEIARDEAKAAREVINNKLDDNTALTKVASNNLQTMAGQRMAIALGRKQSFQHAPEFVEIMLPGVDYEQFGLSTGELVEWRSEYCERGRKVRFKVHGPASIGFHFHLLAEINFGVAGTLVYETLDRIVNIGPGESFTAEADEIHKASFDGPGEACCVWPDQDSDVLTIGFYPQ